MASGESLVAPMRVEPIGGARRALPSQVDPRVGDARVQEAAADGAREVDRFLPARMRPAKRGVEFERHVRSDRKAAGVDAGTDDGVQRGAFGTLGGEPFHRSRGDAGAGAPPAGVKERAVAAIGGDDRDGGAVGGGNGGPRIAGANHEAVGLGARFSGRDKNGAVDLAQEQRCGAGVAEHGAERLAIPSHRLGIVADAEAHVERGVGTAAPAPEAGRHAEPYSSREHALRRSPEGNGIFAGRGRLHGPEGARLTPNAQANCARAPLAPKPQPPRRALLATMAMAASTAILFAGCARVPVSASGADARARLLADRAAAGGPIRGVGDIEADIAGRGGSFEARWGSAGESLVVIGYSGPLRVLDATLLRDSVFVAIRPRDFGVAGLVRPESGFGADGLRFLLRPWDFGPRWIRDALERAAADPIEGGWRLRGTGETEAGAVTFALDITSRGEPRRLELARADDPRSVAVVRYGALRRYAAGRYPRWIEWSRDDARVRLDVRDIGTLPEGKLRLLPPAPSEWRVVSLDDPEGRELLGRLIGAPAKEEPR